MLKFRLLGRGALRSALIAAAGLLFALGAPTLPSAAADARPARKDSRAAAQPKGVVLTPSVTPNQARPGDPVTYQVTATVQTPWHIYKYSKTQPEDGPRNTQFDFFET